MMRLEQKVFNKFINTGKTLTIAESCTGGLLSHLITNIPGASAFFVLSVIAYANNAKTRLLKVPIKLLKEHGAVSHQTASAMAQGARTILNTDCALAITGIAGPTGSSKKKPVGLVFIAISTQKKTIVKKFIFKGSRVAIKKAAAQTALKMLAK